MVYMKNELFAGQFANMNFVETYFSHIEIKMQYLDIREVEAKEEED